MYTRCKESPFSAGWNKQKNCIFRLISEKVEVCNIIVIYSDKHRSKKLNYWNIGLSVFNLTIFWYLSDWLSCRCYKFFTFPRIFRYFHIVFCEFLSCCYNVTEHFTVASVYADASIPFIACIPAVADFHTVSGVCVAGWIPPVGVSAVTSYRILLPKNNFYFSLMRGKTLVPVNKVQLRWSIIFPRRIH